MSERRNKLSKKNRTKAYIAAGLVHLVIIGLMLFNFSTKRETVDAADADKIDVVKAALVDDAQIKQEQEKIKKRERDKKLAQERERKRLEDLKKKSKAEEKRLEELKKKKVNEQKKADELEKQRKEIALKKQKEEDERKKKAEEERKKKEAKKKRQQELERIKKEEQELESQRRLNESLAAEEAFIAEQRAKQRATTLMGKYTALIIEKVRRYRTISPGFQRYLATKVNVKLSPSGDVKSVRVVKSSGNVQYDRSVETAIRQASPLPIPSVSEDSEVNKLFQDLNINFDMSGL